MSRIELAGEGTPIPEFALPDPNLDIDLPPVRLVLPPGAWLKAESVALGYTHFEVWCIGAAGGKGSDGFRGVTYDVYFVGTSEHSHNARLDPGGIIAWGGAGGGGGLHHISGTLASLPDSVPVVVGSAGANASPYSGYLAIYSPEVTFPWFMDSDDVYDLPHPTFYPPLPGSDGGVSSFNGTLCRASGGKGGFGVVPWETRPPGMWEHGVYVSGAWGGNGGAGGAGNSAAAGGGGAGSATDGVRGSDGPWDGSVGKGGGAGRAGYVKTYDPGPSGVPIPKTYQAPSAGGQGSYSFSDTTVFGDRGSPVDHDAGGGGGAKVGSLKYGSHAAGYDPNGAVIIRLTKII